MTDINVSKSNCMIKGIISISTSFMSLFSSNIPAYGVYVSQLIRYARASAAYSDFLVRSRLLTTKLLGQGYNRFKLIATCKKFYGRQYDLIAKYQLSVTYMVTDLFLETLFLR